MQKAGKRQNLPQYLNPAPKFLTLSLRNVQESESQIDSAGKFEVTLKPKSFD